jgi:hypothetical protein
MNYFTYHLQEKFIDSNKLVSFEGTIKEITKTDSTYILRIHNTNSAYSDKHYNADITVNNKMFSVLRKIIDSENHSYKGCFVFKACKIISANPEIKSNFELDGEDTYSYLEYDFHGILVIFKGDLIDFYINETAEKSDDD